MSDVRPMRVMPGTTAPRNGMPPSGGYVYRGTGEDALTPTHPGAVRRRKPVPASPPSPPDATRLRELEELLAARGVVAVPEPAPASPPRCKDCGYPVTAPGHSVTCGDGAP